jgi:hypothetical protein
MTKKKTKITSTQQTTQTKPTDTRLNTLGIVMLLLSPLLYYITIAISQDTCPRTEFGSCELGYGMSGAFIAMVAPYISGAIAICILIYVRLKK